jgi:uncharacterized protein
MKTDLILGLIILGFFAGWLSGLLGIGGAIVIIPVLIYVFGFSIKDAQGTSLAALTLPIGILAAASFYKQGYVNIQGALLIAFGFFFGAYFGAKTNHAIKSEYVEKIFAVLLVFIAVRMWWKN